jgi:hypothetical protein
MEVGSVGVVGLPGDVACKVGNLHLLAECLVDILFGGWVEEAESGFTDSSKAVYDPGVDFFFLAEFAKGFTYFDVIVKT